MGFFKRLFQRKKGGTLVGNLIRRIAHRQSYGLFGNGTQLRKWESRQK